MARRGGFNMPNMNRKNMMKEIEKLQKQMEEAQEKVDNLEVTASAGGGIVEVTVNGKNEVKNVKIDPEALDPEDVEMLEDMILVCVNDALNQVKEKSENEMGKLTGGLNIPGL